jgi:hypothetical protein
MSVYSHYASGSMTASDIVANESYSGIASAFQMIQESAENEHSIFESVIGQDFAEAYNKFNPAVVSESQLESIQESVAGGIWSKIIAFIHSIGEKILGIIKSLKDRIVMVFVRDGKELVKKYGKKVNANMNGGKLAKMKFKYAAPKDSLTKDKAFEDVISGSSVHAALNTRWDAAAKAVKLVDGAMNTDQSHNAGDELPGDYKAYTAEQKTDFLENGLSQTIGGKSTTLKDYAKDFDTACFDEVKDVEGLKEDVLKRVIDVIQGSKEYLDKLDKNEAATKKSIKEMESKAKKAQDDASKALGEKDVKNHTVWINACAGQVSSLCSIYSTVAGRYYGSLGVAIKKDLKQSRSIFVKAATYNPKQSANEQVDLLVGVEEASDYEVDDMFDGAETLFA